MMSGDGGNRSKKTLRLMRRTFGGEQPGRQSRAGEVVCPWEGGADGGGSVALASSGAKFISFDGLVPLRSQKSSFDNVSE
jgi:hypothetical protein